GGSRKRRAPMKPLNPVRPSDQRTIPLLLAEPSSDAAVSSGPSPTAPALLPPASPTLHLIGAGKVGRAFLRLLADLPLRLIAVSDTSATLFSREGLDARALA